MLDTKISSLNPKHKTLSRKMLRDFNDKNLPYATGEKYIYDYSFHDDFIQNKIIYTINIPDFYLMKEWYKFFNDLV